MKQMRGIFTISLDFELHWGGFEKWPLGKGKLNATPVNGHRFLKSDKKDLRNYFLNTRQVVPEMLNLFAKYEIHATWATVGMLFHKNRKSMLECAPADRPAYKLTKLSAYEYIETTGIGNDEAEDPYHFAPSLIEKIVATPYQELGTHTFAHYYTNEAGQTVSQFHEDLKAAQRSAEMYGRSARSLVFPRNQFNDQALKICMEEGITAVRTNPLDWFWDIDATTTESVWKRLNRGLDAYLPIGRRNTYTLESLKQRKGYPLCIPASRLLRRYHPREYFLNELKIRRIQAEMTRAAMHGEVYHLWWHPHNFGHHPEQSLRDLVRILKHYEFCRKTYGMTSLNMGEITEVVAGKAEHMKVA
jgi:peptidoglycan/xylan/chitin deacetylase (PgdA/CDA1 family)